MLIDLSGKVAIVTGGGRGIGREISRRLASEGVIVVVADIRRDLLDEVTEEWRQQGWQGAQLVCDVRDGPATRVLAEDVVQRFGRIDILVNNAGVANGGPVETLPQEVWDLNMQSNLTATFLMCQAVIPQMKKQGSGRILNAASFAAIIPSLGSAAYAASKAGVESFTRVLAGEMGPFNVTVNCYSPGMIPTEMNKYAEASPERQEMLLDTLTLRRWGEAGDIASLICFLASDFAAYITGTMIDISGGKFATQIPWLAHRDKR
jgi:3-oxoacyl-[acyl-carrier protein] reductase